MVRGFAFVLGLCVLGAAGGVGISVGAERDTVVLESPGNPLVSFRFVFHVGSSQDPPGKEGLAALTAKMLSQGGTEEMSMREVMEFLYPMAARVSAQPDKEVTTFIGRAHHDHLEEFFSVFRDRLQKPRFDPRGFREEQRRAPQLSTEIASKL